MPERDKPAAPGRWLLSFAIAIGALTGGALAGSYATGSIAVPAYADAVPDPAPTLDLAYAGDASEAEAGTSWAASAYASGLRTCPAPSPEFLRACEARMKEERVMAAERPPVVRQASFVEPKEPEDFVYGPVKDAREDPVDDSLVPADEGTEANDPAMPAVLVLRDTP